MRIIQEALANVRKHADASHAEVRLSLHDQSLEATIEDNGAGFEPERWGGRHCLDSA